MSKNKPKTQQQTNNVIRQAQSKTEMTKPFLANRKAEWILVSVVLLVFSNTIFNNYGFDDEVAIYGNGYVRQGIKGIPDILTHSYLYLQGQGVDYRPVSEITFAIEQSVFNENPHVSHFLNLLLYTSIVLLLFYCLEKIWLKKLPNARALAFFICLLYAVHPVHTEVVDSLKNREELFAFLFALLWFAGLRQYFEKGKVFYAVGAFAVLILCLLSKLVSLPFVFLALFWFWWFENRKDTRFYVSAVFSVAISLLIMGLIASNTHRTIFDLENPLYVNDTLLNRLGMCFDSLAFYVRLMIVPNPLSFYYGYNTIPLEIIFSLKPFLTFLVSVSALVYAFVMLKKRDIRGYFIMVFFGIFALYSNVIGIYTGIVAERTLFQSSLFFIGFSVLLADKIHSVRFAVFFVFFAVFSVLTVKRNFEWKDTLTLMKSDISHLENSTLANYFYATNSWRIALETKDASTKEHLVKEAVIYLKKTLTISPNYADASLCAGRIAQYYYNNLDTALFYYEKAYKTNRNQYNDELFYELGRSYCIESKYAIAKPFFDTLYAHNPTDSNNLYFEARCLFNTGSRDSGFAVNRKLLKGYPNYSFGYLNEGWFFELSNELDSAAVYYQKSIDLGNRDSYVIHYLSNYYSRKEDKVSVEKIEKLR